MNKYESGYLEKQGRCRERGVMIYMSIASFILLIESVVGYINDAFMICFWFECVTAFFFIVSGLWYLPVGRDTLTQFIEHSSPESAGLLFINHLVIYNIPVRGKHIYQARRAREVQIHKSITNNLEVQMFTTLEKHIKTNHSSD